MRVAISTDDDRGLEGVVSHHFGRCKTFTLVDLEERQVVNVQSVENPFSGQHQPGEVPGFINGQGANVMITGGMGGRAIQFFEQYQIQPVTGAFGTVEQALEQFVGGVLKDAAPCAESVEHQHGHVEADDQSYEHGPAGRLLEEAQSLQGELTDVLERIKRLQEN
jgi:predicted Fe-Mo cluster-binding NifX family protein